VDLQRGLGGALDPQVAREESDEVVDPEIARGAAHWPAGLPFGFVSVRDAIFSCSLRAYPSGSLAASTSPAGPRLRAAIGSIAWFIAASPTTPTMKPALTICLVLRSVYDRIPPFGCACSSAINASTSPWTLVA